MGFTKMKKDTSIRIMNRLKKSTPEKIWRLRNKAKKSKWFFKLYYTYKYYRCLEIVNSEIPLSAFFCSQPAFPHGIKGVFVSSGAKIGSNCVIFQQVTIGSNTIQGSKGYGSPQIGNNVYIGAGAKIIGGIKVGDNVRIGANCVVVGDFPDNSTVVLDKPRIILHQGTKKIDSAFHKYMKD